MATTMAESKDDVPREVRLRVLARYAGMCAFCGRPCGEHEIWRRVEDGAVHSGETCLVPVCFVCFDVLFRAGVRPARYEARVVERRPPAFGLLLFVLVDLLTFLWLAVWGAFGALTAVVLWRTPLTPWYVLPELVLVTLLLVGAQALAHRLAGWIRHRRESGAASPQHMERIPL